MLQVGNSTRKFIEASTVTLLLPFLFLEQHPRLQNAHPPALSARISRPTAPHASIRPTYLAAGVAPFRRWQTCRPLAKAQVVRARVDAGIALELGRRLMRAGLGGMGPGHGRRAGWMRFPDCGRAGKGGRGLLQACRRREFFQAKLSLPRPPLFVDPSSRPLRSNSLHLPALCRSARALRD